MLGKRIVSVLLLGGLVSVSAPSLAAPRLAAPVPPFAERCKNAGERGQNPQGPALWGLQAAGPSGELATKPLVQHVELRSAASELGPATTLQFRDGRLTTGRRTNAASDAGSTDPLVGAVLMGVAPDGARVPLAICAASPSPMNPSVQLYNVQYFNKAKLAWQNICGVSNDKDNKPLSGTEGPQLAVAVSGRWRLDGAREEARGAFTFACETGAIAKCAVWGYVPGQSRGGRSLTDYHEACTRMARADYCGNGQPHTTAGVTIDLYDDLGVQKPSRMSNVLFEAAWSPDGAYCLSRARKDQPLDPILKECPERFAPNTRTDLGDGDTCTLKAKGAGRPLLRNGFLK